MGDKKRETVEHSIEKASRHLQVARQHLESRVRYSEAVEAAQECIELSVKALLSLLEIDYPPSHGWDQEKRQFGLIAKQIQDRMLLAKLAAGHLHHTVPLPRLLFLVNFWAQFYTTAKYGFEPERLASAQDLIHAEEATLAVRNAEECHRAVSAIRYLEQAKLDILLGRGEDAPPARH